MTVLKPNTTDTLIARLDHTLALVGPRAEAVGNHALRYGLVLILL